MAQERGLFERSSGGGGKGKQKGLNKGIKEEMKSFKEGIIRDIVAENMDIQGIVSALLYCPTTLIVAFDSDAWWPPLFKNEETC